MTVLKPKDIWTFHLSYLCVLMDCVSVLFLALFFKSTYKAFFKVYRTVLHHFLKEESATNLQKFCHEEIKIKLNYSELFHLIDRYLIETFCLVERFGRLLRKCIRSECSSRTRFVGGSVCMYVCMYVWCNTLGIIKYVTQPTNHLPSLI